MDFVNIAFAGGAPGAAEGASGGAPAAGNEATPTSGDRVSTLLAGGSAAFGFIGDVQAGRSQAQALRFSAEFDELAAEGALVTALGEANDLNEQLLENMAQNIAAGAASGIDVTSGAIADTNIRSAQKTGRAVARTRVAGEFAASGLRLRASQKRAGARSAELAGFLKAGGRAFQAGSRAARVG